MRISLIRLGCALLLAGGTLLSPTRAHAQQSGARSEVYVLSTLYRRHAQTPAYGHDTLRALIERVRPDVVVLDVSPRELREQTVHPSKAEYPQVIFPLARTHGYRAYPAEPDEPEFTEIVSGLSRSLETFRTSRPDAASVDSQDDEATYAALARLWRTPADVNGALTDRLLATRRHVQDVIAGPEVANAWRRWNDHTLSVIRRAAQENPGRRVLVLIGVENAAMLRPALAGDANITLVDVEAWLSEGGRR